MSSILNIEKSNSLSIVKSYGGWIIDYMQICNSVSCIKGGNMDKDDANTNVIVEKTWNITAFWGSFSYLSSQSCLENFGIYYNLHKYVGESKNGMIEGDGIKYYSNGDKYEGQLKNDMRNGEGTMTWNDGDVYTGDWKDDKMNGKGVYTWPNGYKYVGEFKNDMIEGNGIKYDSNGDMYEGQWKSVLRNGNGNLTRENGDVKDNPRNGKGNLTYGEVQWKGDLLQGI